MPNPTSPRRAARSFAWRSRWRCGLAGVAGARGTRRCSRRRLTQARAPSGARGSAEPPSPAPAAPARRAGRGLLRQVRDRASDMVVAAMNFVGVPLPARRRLGRDRLRLQRLHAPRLRDEPGPGAAAPRRRAGRARPAWSPSSATSCSPATWSSSTRCGATFSHVGIYIGDDRFIHSPRPGQRCAPRTWASPTGPSASPARAAPSVPRCSRRRPRRRDGPGASPASRPRPQAPGRAARRRRGPRGTIARMSRRKSSPSPTTATARALPRDPGALEAPTGELRRPPRPAAARPAHLGHRPLQLPLQLLHAEGGLRHATTPSCRSRRC